MSETPKPQTEIDQIIMSVYQLLKRAEDRLKVTQEYVKRHTLNHSINYIHQELLGFIDFRERVFSDTTVQLTGDQKNNFVLTKALCLLALVNRALENYDAALQLADKALSLNPNEAKAYIEIADFHLRNKDYVRTIVVSTQAINLNPNDSVGYWIRGQGYSGKNDYPAAISDFESAARLNPSESYIFLSLGVIYYAQAKYKESIFNYTKTVELDPTSASGFSRRGFAYLKLKQFRKARADFDQTKLIYPDFGYQITTSFADIKPVKNYVIIIFMALCIVSFYVPFLLGKEYGFNRLILLEITGWLLFIGIFFLGKLKLKDIGLTLNHLVTGVGLTFFTGLLVQLMGQGMKIFTNQQNIFVPTGFSDDLEEVLQFYVFYIYPILVLQEFFFRGVLFPQIFLKLRGPYRTFSSIVGTTTIAATMQFLFLLVIANSVVSFENTLFSLIFVNYLITSVYFISRNLYWCIGIILLIFPSLETVRPMPYILILFFAVILLLGLFYLNSRIASKKANILILNDQEDHYNNLISYAFSKRWPIYLLMIIFAAGLVGLVWLDNILVRI